MKKYVTVRTERDLTRWETVHDSLEEANKEAEAIWDHLTAEERKKNRVDVGWVEDTPDFFTEEDLAEEALDWVAFQEYLSDERCLSFGNLGYRDWAGNSY